MNKKKTDSKNAIVHEEDVGVDSFKRYKSSDDDKTKIVDGEKVIEDFHLYKEEDK